MPIYERYAQVYDDSGQVGFSLRMIPYLDELLQRHPVPGRSMLDLACGTGTVALGFATQGWEVYGVDGSAAMLAQARHKAAAAGLHPVLSQQDMREFILPHAVDLVTCLYDSLNYMLSLPDLARVFQRVAGVLRPGGAFMADLNTREMLQTVWGDNTFLTDDEDLALAMVSAYEPETGLSTVHVIGFVRGVDGLYERFDELHTENAYPNEQVRAALQSAGLQVEAAYDCFHLEPPRADSRRILWIARKPTGAL